MFSRVVLVPQTIEDGIVRFRAIEGRITGQITDVVISHHNPDHTINVGMFPNARVHDHWAWYRDDPIWSPTPVR